MTESSQGGTQSSPDVSFLESEIALPASRKSWSSSMRTLEEFLAESYPEPGWYVPDLIPMASLVFFAGAPGSYKTFLAVACALAIRDGRNVFDQIDEVGSFGLPTSPANILFVEEEMNGGTFQARTKSLMRGTSAGKSSVRLTISSGFKLSEPADVDLLRAICVEHSIKLVFMDPFSSVLGAGDENDNSKVSEIMDRLRSRVIDDPEVAASVVLIHHPAKNSQGAASSLRGAGDILGKADHAITFERNATEPKIRVTCIKSRLLDFTTLPILDVEFRRMDEKVEVALVGSTTKQEEKKKNSKVTEMSEEILRAAKAKGGAFKQKFILDALAITSNGTFKRAWKSLSDEGKIVLNSDGVYVLPQLPLTSGEVSAIYQSAPPIDQTIL